jgi:hypothetical protein
MIKNLLLLFALLCLGVMSRAQTNLTYNDKLNTGFITTDAVGYCNAEGVFYCNYGKTAKVSNSSGIVNLEMFEKDMVWMEESGGVIFLKLYDGKNKLSLAAGQSISGITVTVDYILYINYTASGQRQVFRYDRRTGVTTQMTNETGGVDTLSVTDSRKATFTFTYATVNHEKPGNYYLISRKRGASSTV